MLVCKQIFALKFLTLSRNVSADTNLALCQQVVKIVNLLDRAGIQDTLAAFVMERKCVVYRQRVVNLSVMIPGGGLGVVLYVV